MTGDGTAASGGTITGSTGPGVNLTNTAEVQLDRMIVTAGGDDGIRGAGVTGLVMTDTSVTSNGNAVGEKGFDLTELAGDVTRPITLTGLTVTGNADDNLAIVNDAANVTQFTLDGGTYGTNSTTTGNDGVRIENNGTGAFTGAEIKNAAFTNNRGDHIQIVTDNSTTAIQTIAISDNTLSSAPASATVLGGGISLGAGGSADPDGQRRQQRHRLRARRRDVVQHHVGHHADDTLDRQQQPDRRHRRGQLRLGHQLGLLHQHHRRRHRELHASPTTRSCGPTSPPSMPSRTPAPRR